MQVGYEKIAIFDQYLTTLYVVNGSTAKCYTHSCARPWQVGDTYQLSLVSGVICCLLFM